MHLSVVTSRRLKLAKRGPTQLPLTLRVAKAGQVEIWLSRSNKLIINIQVGTLKPSKFGLRLRMHPAASKAALKLRLTFISTGVKPTATINLNIPTI